MCHRLRHVWALGFAALLGACGGGGGDDTVVTAPPFDPVPGVDFNAFAAWTNFLTANRTWAVTGVGSDGLTYAITIATAPGPTSIFPITGATTARSDAIVTTQAGGTLSTVLQQTFFDPVTFQVVGLATELEGVVACDVALPGLVPPTAARIPSSGTLAVLDQRGDCGVASASVGSVDLTWSLDFVAGISLFCINSTQRSPGGTILFLESDCVEVSPDGTLGDNALVSLEQPNVLLLEARSF